MGVITGCVRFKPGKMEKKKCEVLQCALFYTVYPYRSPLELYTLFPALLPPPEDGGEYFFGDGGGDPIQGGIEAVSCHSVPIQGLTHTGDQEEIFWHQY